MASTLNHRGQPTRRLCRSLLVEVYKAYRNNPSDALAREMSYYAARAAGFPLPGTQRQPRFRVKKG